MVWKPRAVLVLCALSVAAAQSSTVKPGDAELNQAYQALAHKDYDAAIALFRSGLAKQPGNAAAHKDLAYTLLKAGQNEEARDEFEAAMRANPQDDTAALEYAFLAYETKKPIEARRMFDRLRHSANPATRATAEQAFQNIDRPLAEGIARWKQALAQAANPNDLSTFSAHWELAQLAELRDELPLAAEQYEICHKLKPQLPELLLILARIWREMGHLEEARAALLAASRSADSRTAALALEQMDPRYPYPYEFLNALKLDPQNTALRRELAYLYLAMHQKAEAIEQFKQVLAIDPKDRLSQDQLNSLLHVSPQPKAAPERAPAVTPAVDAKSMGKKSFALGYLQDAIRYLREAHEQDPNDAEVMLDLGWAYNQAGDDSAASYWFDQARRSEDPNIAAQALQAYRNLNPELFPHTTVWLLPMYSSRWNDMFSYGQIKRTIPLPWRRADRFFSLYLSTRLDGDLRARIRTVYGSGYLSDGALIFGAGIASRTWHRFLLWGEAGEAIYYLPAHSSRASPDYRGGLHFDKGFGSLLGSSHSGFFSETSADAIYVRAFGGDWIGYSQNRMGRTWRVSCKSSLQTLWNVNYTRDLQRQYWANTLEFGPGLKFHLPGMPPNLYLSADFLRGKYLLDPYVDPTYRTHFHYTDVRIGFWFARTR